MKIKKWNAKKNSYDIKEIPDSMNCKIHSDDMNEIINCANCGKQIAFGEAYTSSIYQSESGFGYAICHECLMSEMKEKAERKKEKDFVAPRVTFNRRF